MQQNRIPWSREHTIIAFNLYCKIPFAKAVSSNLEIIKLAHLLGRSVNSVKMKVGNFGSLDPELKKRGIVGLTNTSRLDKEIWNEFHQNWEELAYQSELLIEQLSQKASPNEYIPIGKEREVTIRQRVNQSFFRNTVLSSYNNCCCVTGLSQVFLIEACHIVSWADNPEHRLNPQNGLCLNSLWHKAYDNNLISIDADYRIHVSTNPFSITESEERNNFQNFFSRFKGKFIRLPDRFTPLKDFLDIRHQKYLEKI